MIHLDPLTDANHHMMIEERKQTELRKRAEELREIVEEEIELYIQMVLGDEEKIFNHFYQINIKEKL